jgi:hypothetical protein
MFKPKYDLNTNTRQQMLVDVAHLLLILFLLDGHGLRIFAYKRPKVLCFIVLTSTFCHNATLTQVVT